MRPDAEAPQTPITSDPRHILAEDFDGDGVLDIVASLVSVGAGARIGTLLGQGGGSFAQALLFASVSPVTTTTADVDRDGTVDVLAASQGAQPQDLASVYLNLVGE